MLWFETTPKNNLMKTTSNKGKFSDLPLRMALVTPMRADKSIVKTRRSLHKSLNHGALSDFCSMRLVLGSSNPRPDQAGLFWAAF